MEEGKLDIYKYIYIYIEESLEGGKRNQKSEIKD